MDNLIIMFDQQLLSSQLRNNNTSYDVTGKNIQISHPDICTEWDTENNVHHPNYYTYESNDIVSWKCKNSCGCHKWTARISSRAKGNNKCPNCKRGNYCDHNNLTISHPYLCEQWDSERNKDKTPDKYNRSSKNIIWWKCNNNHNWRASINNRIFKKLSCPFCN